MSTRDGAGPGGRPLQTRRRGHGQPTASRDWGYSPGWRMFSVIIGRPLLWLPMRYRWQGQGNIPRTGGVILAPNHLSYADWPAVARFSYIGARRYPVFMIKSAVFEVRVLGPLMDKLGQLPVYRGRSDAALVLRQAEQALRAGACVIVYPEGTASRDPDLWPMVGKSGAARLALSTGAPVIPVAHWGAQDVLPYGTWRPHLFPRTTIRMAAGPPVDLSAYHGQRLTASTLRAATADIMADITTLLATIRQQRPPAVPYDPAVGSHPPPTSAPPSSPGTDSGTATAASQDEQAQDIRGSGVDASVTFSQA